LNETIVQKTDDALS